MIAPPRSGSAGELREAFDRAFATLPDDRDNETEPMLALRIGGDPYAVRVLQTSGLVQARRIARLPSSCPTLLGLAGVRGRIVAVHGLESLLGYAPAREAPRWLLLAGGDEAVALAVTHLESHFELSLSAPRARDATTVQPHAPELVQLADDVRAVIDVPSVVRAIRESVGIEPSEER